MAPWKGPRNQSWAKNVNLAHFSMGLLFVTWLAFQVALGRDAAPPVLDQLLGVCGGVWFGIVCREQGRKDEDTHTTAIRTEAKVNRLDDELHGGDG